MSALYPTERKPLPKSLRLWLQLLEIENDRFIRERTELPFMGYVEFVEKRAASKQKGTEE